MPICFSLIKYWNPVFIETGTFRGQGVTLALRAHFKSVHSIELNPEFYSHLTGKFERQIKSGRLHLHCGDSLQLLPRILSGVDCQATFWLDAHYCGAETARGGQTSPLLGELDIIAGHPVRTHTILIDDVRLFGTNTDEDWRAVTLAQVIGKIKTINPDYRIRYERGQVEGDVLVAQIGSRPVLRTIGFLEELAISFLRAVLRLLRKPEGAKG